MISNGAYDLNKEKMKKNIDNKTKKHYSIHPIPSIWMILTIATLILTILKVAGATFPIWIVFLPLGIPIALLVALPVYVLIAIVAVLLFVFALIVLSIPPFLVLALVFGINEKIDDHNLGV